MPPDPAPAPAPDPAHSIFINCPYDKEYEPLFDALVFTIVYCGFIPRSATESGSVSEARMERIFSAIFGSKFSIHDLSRCRGEGEEVLARFNMPLELGIAMTRRKAGLNDASQHDWLVLVPKKAPYAHFISDLAGFDLMAYDGTPEPLVRCVMSWLSTRPGALGGVSPRGAIAKLEDFRKAKATLKAEWTELIPWSRLVLAATQVARQQ